MSVDAAGDRDAEFSRNRLKQGTAIRATACFAVHELHTAVGAKDSTEAGQNGAEDFNIGEFDTGAMDAVGVEVCVASGDAGRTLGAVAVEAEEEDVATAAKDVVDCLFDSVGHAAQGDWVASGPADVSLFELCQ